MQTPVGFKCYEDARGARVIFGYEYLQDRRVVRSALRILVFMLPLLLLIGFRVGTGVGPSGLIVSLGAAVLLSIILTLGIRWLTRRF